MATQAAANAAAAAAGMKNMPRPGDDDPITGGFEYQTPPPTPKTPAPPAMAALKTNEYSHTPYSLAKK